MAKNTIFDPAAFDKEHLTCESCGWEGEGRDAVIIDLYGVGKNREVHCPECDRFLGALPADNNPMGDSGNQLGFQIG